MSLCRRRHTRHTQNTYSPALKRQLIVNAQRTRTFLYVRNSLQTIRNRNFKLNQKTTA